MSEESQYLKWKMEQVWITRGCVCPSHVANWSEYERGYRFYDAYKSYILLWYKKGRSLGPKRQKIKGKGFSFLMKSYGIATMIVRKRKEAIANCTCAQPHDLPVWYCETHGEVAVDAD